MINTLRGYIENSLPREGIFSTNPGLTAKVDPDGKLLPYAGNTAVFLLDEQTVQAILPIQERLYSQAGHLLAEPLFPDTFHLTLHDLANGKPGSETEQWMAQTEPVAAALLAQLKAESDAPVNMKATWTFNMVSTSIVLGAEPADGESWERLSHMYETLNQVVPLNYALSPHITLAYFRPGCYSVEELEPLRRLLTPVELAFPLRMENLVLQNFTDMRSYTTI